MCEHGRLATRCRQHACLRFNSGGKAVYLCTKHLELIGARSTIAIGASRRPRKRRRFLLALETVPAVNRFFAIRFERYLTNSAALVTRGLETLLRRAVAGEPTPRLLRKARFLESFHIVNFVLINNTTQTAN